MPCVFVDCEDKALLLLWMMDAVLLARYEFLNDRGDWLSLYSNLRIKSTLVKAPYLHILNMLFPYDFVNAYLTPLIILHLAGPYRSLHLHFTLLLSLLFYCPKNVLIDFQIIDVVVVILQREVPLFYDLDLFILFQRVLLLIEVCELVITEDWLSSDLFDVVGDVRVNTIAALE